MKHILDSKYSKSNIKTIAESSNNFDPQERNDLYILLKKYECLFDVNIGTWHRKPYDIKLKPDAEPYHGKPFPVPRIHELTFKQEIDRLEALKFNAKKSCLGAHKFDYLDYHVTRDGVMPIPNRVKAIHARTVPKNCKQLRQFIGMINLYRDMWQKRSDIFPPLTALTPKKSNTTGKTSTKSALMLSNV